MSYVWLCADSGCALVLPWLFGFLTASLLQCCYCFSCVGLCLAFPVHDLCLRFDCALGLLASPLLLCCAFSALLCLCCVCGGTLPVLWLSLGCAWPGLCACCCMPVLPHSSPGCAVVLPWLCRILQAGLLLCCGCLPCLPLGLIMPTHHGLCCAHAVSSLCFLTHSLSLSFSLLLSVLCVSNSVWPSLAMI